MVTRLQARPRTRPDDRRRYPRVCAGFDVEVGGAHPQRGVAVDVSRDGLLVVVDRLPPPGYVVALTIRAPHEAPLSVMAIVVRHAVVGGAPAIGVRLFAASHAIDRRWARLVEKAPNANVRPVDDDYLELDD